MHYRLYRQREDDQTSLDSSGQYSLIIKALPIWLPVILFAGLAAIVVSGHTPPGDISSLNIIHQATGHRFDMLAKAASTISDVVPVIVGGFIAIGLLYILGQRVKSIFLGFCIAGTAAAGFVFKFIFNRDRPTVWPHLTHESLNSFPSGHAITSSTLGLCLIIFCWNTRFRVPAIIVAVIYALTVAASRLIGGVHYPSDIIAGWLVSISLVSLLVYLFTRFWANPIDTNNSRPSKHIN